MVGRKAIQELAVERARSSLAGFHGQHILEVGAGSGRLSQQMAAEGAAVAALDLVQPPDLHHENARFVRHDLTEGTLPFADASFDGVISTEVIEHMKAPFLLLASMVRVLRPGGTLIVTMPNYWNLKYRLRYLLTGNVPMPVEEDSGWSDRYLAGYAPHINVLTWPTLHAVLTWEGCEEFHVETPRTFGWRRKLGYLPLYLMVKVNQWLTRQQRAGQLLLADLSSSNVLFGSRHVLMSCRRASDQPRTMRTRTGSPGMVANSGAAST